MRQIVLIVLLAVKLATLATIVFWHYVKSWAQMLITHELCNYVVAYEWFISGC